MRYCVWIPFASHIPFSCFNVILRSCSTGFGINRFNLNRFWLIWLRAQIEHVSSRFWLNVGCEIAITSLYPHYKGEIDFLRSQDGFLCFSHAFRIRNPYYCSFFSFKISLKIRGTSAPRVTGFVNKFAAMYG